MARPGFGTDGVRGVANTELTAELAVALEEGMPNGDDDLQRSILLALEDLRARIDTERAGPTKHHGLAG